MSTWYCVQHRAGFGAQTKCALRRAGFEVHWPREVIRPFRRDDVLRPLFPGYLFAQVAAGRRWGAILSVSYVLGIVGIRDRGTPCVVPDKIVEALIACAGAIDLAIDNTPEAKMERALGHDVSSDLMPGGRVRILAPGFEGLEGVLCEDRGDERVRVLLEILGGSREVAVPRSMVEAVQ